MQSLAVPRQHSSQPRCPSSNRAALDEDRERPIRLVTFTTLFPNDAEPNHGVFVENRLVRLVATGAATSTVLAPIPYVPALPLGTRRFGRWSRLALAARREMRHGIAVHHPRYPVIPRAGMSVAPALLYAASARALSAMLASGQRFDAIDAHYLYPDGVMAVWLGRRFGLPVVVTARGSDVSQLPRYAVPRHLIRQAMANADALVAVSAALKNAMLSLGAADERVTVLRNGVDGGQFRPADRSAARRELGLHGPTLLSVGHLIERKGHHRAIEAMRLLPGYELLIAGEGPERARLEALIRKLGLRTG